MFACALLAALVTAAAADAALDAEGGFARCGTRSLDEAEVAAKELGRVDFLERMRLQRGQVSREGFSVTVPVVVHCVHDAGAGTGLITRAQAEAQIDVLNEGFEGVKPGSVGVDTGVRYELQSLLYHDDPANFLGCRSSAAMKRAYAVEPATVMNVYTCQPSGGVLGFITHFPDEAPASSYVHGIVLRFDTLPGGGLAPYDGGATAVHEAGHFFGLYHTFQPNDGTCHLPVFSTIAGDAVEDTPVEASPAFGTCAANFGRNTCFLFTENNGVPPYFGLDPVSNFMDYTVDSCMSEFTEGQATRMMQMMLQFKPALTCLPGNSCNNGPPVEPPSPFSTV